MKYFEKKLTVIAIVLVFLTSCTQSKHTLADVHLQRQWMLKTLPGVSYDELIKAKTRINLSDINKADAYAGCNSIFFTVKTQGKNSISFYNIGATKMYCEDQMKVENALLTTMPFVKSYTVQGHQMVLRDGAGKTIITAVAADWD